MKTKIKKICFGILKDLGVLAIFLLFILAIGIATNIAMGITINEYIIAT